jgi:RNA polymerase sigma factor (sigma-70 family)
VARTNDASDRPCTPYAARPTVDDLAWLEAFWRTNQQKVLTVCLYTVGSDQGDLVENAVQETLTALLVNVETLRSSATPVALMLKIARNKSIDQLRGELRNNARKNASVARSAPPEIDPVPELVFENIDRHLVRQCWVFLNPQDQQLLAFIAQGISQDQMAHMLQLSVSTIKRRINRAKRRFYALLVNAGVNRADQARLIPREGES